MPWVEHIVTHRCVTLFLRINKRTHLHTCTQTHPEKRDYPCQRFGWGLIWSNGGSESWFVFPSLVRLRSSLPGDTTSCILTPSDTKMHPQPRHPAYLTHAHRYRDCYLCAAAHLTILKACDRVTDNQIIYESTHTSPRAHHFFVFEAQLPLDHFFHDLMWTWQAPSVHCNANRQMRRERFVFFHLERALSHLLMSCHIIWCHQGQSLNNGDEWNCQWTGTGVLYWHAGRGEDSQAERGR